LTRTVFILPCRKSYNFSEKNFMLDLDQRFAFPREIVPCQLSLPMLECSVTEALMFLNGSIFCLMIFLSESVNLWIRETRTSICSVLCTKLSSLSFSNQGLIIIIISKEYSGMSGISFILSLVIAFPRTDSRPVYMARWNCILKTPAVMCRFPKSGKHFLESRRQC